MKKKPYEGLEQYSKKINRSEVNSIDHTKDQIIISNQKLYAKKSEIADLFSIHPRTLDNMLTEVWRSPEFANIILKWGVKSVRVNITGFEKFLRWKSNERLKSL